VIFNYLIHKLLLLDCVVEGPVARERVIVEPLKVKEVYWDLVSIGSNRGLRITKYDIYHLLQVLKKAYIICRDKDRGGHIVFIPSIFFNLSSIYSIRYNYLSRDPRMFIMETLKRGGIPWCYDSLMNFINEYKEDITLFYAVVESTLDKPAESYRGLALLDAASKIMSRPYSSLIPRIDESLKRHYEMLLEGLDTVYKSLKSKISKLVPSKNGVYVNMRNIATSLLFYTFLREGVKQLLIGHLERFREHPGMPLKLLFDIDEKLIDDVYTRWEEILLKEKEKEEKK